MLKTLESEVIQKTQKFDGFYHLYTINKKTNEIIFIGSKRKKDLDNFKKNLKINKDLDYFITKNTFKQAKVRNNENVLGLNTIVIDIDFHKYEKEEQRILIKLISQHLINHKHILKFSRLVDSGRGLQIHIKIKQTSFVLSWLYQKITEEICKKIEDELNNIQNIYSYNFEFDVDRVSSKNVSGLIRLENTYNTISKTKVKIIYDTQNIFELNDLLDIDVEKKDVKTNFTSNIFEKNLCESRIKYLYSENHSVMEGNRMITMFLLYNNLVQIKENHEEAKADIYRYNSSLIKPLKNNELKTMMHYIDQKGYLKFKQQTFLQWCGGDEMETRAIKRKRNKEKKEIRNKKMEAMLKDKTISYQEIAETLQISLPTVKRYAKAKDLARRGPKKT